MDTARDYDAFKRLVMRLAATFREFASDELIESWWKALKPERYLEIERRIEDFIASATDKTKFPRPGQFRSDGTQAARDRFVSDDNSRNWSELCRRYPTTGPVRQDLAACAAIMATTHESNPAHAQAHAEYLRLEKQLGLRGRFSADA